MELESAKATERYLLLRAHGCARTPRPLLLRGIRLGAQEGAIGRGQRLRIWGAFSHHRHQLVVIHLVHRARDAAQQGATEQFEHELGAAPCGVGGRSWACRKRTRMGRHFSKRNVSEYFPQAASCDL